MGTLRTSEEGSSAAGEGRKAGGVDENRRVDGGAKIVIESGPVGAATLPAPTLPTPQRVQPRAASVAPPAKQQGGRGLVFALYLLAAAALGYAIYERYFL